MTWALVVAAGLLIPLGITLLAYASRVLDERVQRAYEAEEREIVEHLAAMVAEDEARREVEGATRAEVLRALGNLCALKPEERAALESAIAAQIARDRRSMS